MSLRLFFQCAGDGISSNHAIETGNRGVSRSPRRRLICLPLNPGECENIQIPSDFVVKCQVIDIPSVVFLLIWQRHLVQTGGRNKKSRCEPLSPSEMLRSTT